MRSRGDVADGRLVLGDRSDAEIRVEKSAEVAVQLAFELQWDQRHGPRVGGDGDRGDRSETVVVGEPVEHVGKATEGPESTLRVAVRDRALFTKFVGHFEEVLLELRVERIEALDQTREAGRVGHRHSLVPTFLG